LPENYISGLGMGIPLNGSNSFFLWKAAGVATSRLIISIVAFQNSPTNQKLFTLSVLAFFVSYWLDVILSLRFPMVVGEALSVIDGS
jgi:hypothetical protein